MNWLLLRGLAREQRHWGPFPTVLQQRLGGQVLCLDLPGAGTEHRRPSPATVEAITEDLRARWRAEIPSDPPADAEEPWGLVGLSLGGMVALDWLRRHPRDFAAGVVINTSARGVSAPHRRLRPGALLALAKAALARDPVQREQQILAVISNVHGRNYELAATWADFAAERPIGLRTTLFQLRAAMGFGLADPLTTPLLVLASQGDRMVDPACSDAIAEHFDAARASHPTAGHELSLDDPEWVSEEIGRFLNIHGPSRVRVNDYSTEI